MTGNLAQRAYQHRAGLADGFTKRYGVKKLVWFEQTLSVHAAIQREKTMKHWPRRWKINAIQAANPEWRDLYEDLMR